MRFLLKSIRSVLCKVKKDDFIKKIRSFFYVKEKKRLFERGSTFIRWIYYTCITFIKKKYNPIFNPFIEFQNL